MQLLNKISGILIDLDQKTLLNLFKVKSSTNIGNIKTSTYISPSTLKLILKEFWQYVQHGMSLRDLEYFLFFALVLRFIFLAISYNIKTSFIIICIGLVAGYFWLNHLTEVMRHYKILFIKSTYFPGKRLFRDLLLTRRHSPIYLFNKMRVYSFADYVTRHFNEELYYIDPISMLISKIMSYLNESNKKRLAGFYYDIVSGVIPDIKLLIKYFWRQYLPLYVYIILTRITKRFCPYLIRWHWTFLIILKMIEPYFMRVVYRMVYFEVIYAAPFLKNKKLDPDVLVMIKGQVNWVHLWFEVFIVGHFVLMFCGFITALFGQYFYFPILVENTETHVGFRPVESIYSQGATPWQDGPKGSYYIPNIIRNVFGPTVRFWIIKPGNRILKLLRKLIKKIRKKFRRK